MLHASDASDKQIKIFRSFFLGRKDAYGLESSPSPITVREPLTDSLIHDHLKGKKRIGAFLVGKDNRVKTACIDLDQDEPEKLQRIVAALIEKNFSPYLERSKSKGYHVWIFFDEPIEAAIVRKVLFRILKDARVEGVEVFPKQDAVNSNNGLGNYVFLPLHGESVKQERTLFLTFHLKPYPDQWTHLSRIHLTKTENVLSLIKDIPEEAKPIQEKPDSILEGSLDVAKYLIHYNIPFNIKEDGNRTFYLLNRCLFADSHTTKDNLGDSSIVQDTSGKITYQCFHGHCKGRTWADAKKTISGNDPIIQYRQGYEEIKAETKKNEKENLTENIRLWIAESYGIITTDQIYKEFNLTSLKDKTLARVIVHREVEKGRLEKGRTMGQYTVVDEQAESIEILNNKPTPLSIKWPAEIEEYVNIYPSNIVIVGGSPNAGKTAFALNIAHQNKDRFEVFYWSSEMASEELTLRTMEFDCPVVDWKKINFNKRTHDFHQLIKPDALNIVDYLEVIEGKFYLIGDDIRKIYQRLDKGIALICLQMDKGATFAWGGQKTTDKARLYVTLDGNKLTIIKAKNWATSLNPNGLVRSFKLHNGIKFVWDQWERVR